MIEFLFYRIDLAYQLQLVGKDEFYTQQTVVIKENLIMTNKQVIDKVKKLFAMANHAGSDANMEVANKQYYSIRIFLASGITCCAFGRDSSRTPS